jgi:hypothetical protein
MNNRPQQRAIRGAALSPLTPEQRQDLARIARRLFDIQDKFALLAPDVTDFDEWRHRLCRQVVERDGLRQCRQEDFLPLRAHLLRELGAHRAADREETRSLTDDRRRALAVFHRECKQATDVIENPEGYAASIARSKYKTTRIDAELSANQIWTLVFDIRRAAQHRRNKRAA